MPPGDQIVSVVTVTPEATPDNSVAITLAILVGLPIVGMWYQDRIGEEEERRKRQLRFTAPGQPIRPTERKVRVIKREIITTQEEIPGIPPEGVKGLEEF